MAILRRLLAVRDVESPSPLSPLAPGCSGELRRLFMTWYVQWKNGCLGKGGYIRSEPSPHFVSATTAEDLCGRFCTVLRDQLDFQSSCHSNHRDAFPTLPPEDPWLKLDCSLN